MDLNLDEVGREMRLSIEVRNRQHLKRKFKNCFVGAEAVSWLLSASYAATRQEAVSIGKNLITKKLIRHVTDGHSFKDAFLYYRFTLDDPGVANLHTVCAGRGRYSISKQINSTCSSSSNSTEPTYETTDCPFKFSAHTAHNSLVLDLKFTKEIERAFALNGTSKQKRNAILELRQRVRREASSSSPNWELKSTVKRDDRKIKVFRKKHIRGDFTTTKTCGSIEISPVDFLKGFLNFEKRKKWEDFFNDGVVVDSLLAPANKVNNPSNSDTTTTTTTNNNNNNTNDNSNERSNNGFNSSAFAEEEGGESHHDEEWGVSLEGLPEGLPIGKFLDRAEAIGHLSNQMIKSDPDSCMHCNTNLQNAQLEERRICACCGIVVCGVCCSKLVWEVYSKMTVKVCVHCYGESSRIRHNLAMNSGNGGGGKKTKNNYINIANKKEPLPMNKNTNFSGDYNSSSDSNKSNSGKQQQQYLQPLSDNNIDERDSMWEKFCTPRSSEISEFLPSEIKANNDYSDDDEDDDEEVETGENMMVGELILDAEPGEMNWDVDRSLAPVIEDTNASIDNDADADADADADTAIDIDIDIALPPPAAAPPSPPSPNSTPRKPPHPPLLDEQKWAKCKHCGQRVKRTMVEIETHSENCHETRLAQQRTWINHDGNGKNNCKDLNKINEQNIDGLLGNSDGKFDEEGCLGGVKRDDELEASTMRLQNTRVIYRTAKSPSPTLVWPRECCCLQDSFLDDDGTAYVYEISIVHKKVVGCSKHITAEVLLSAYVATHLRRNQSSLTIISQFDPKSSSLPFPSWLNSILPDSGRYGISGAFEALADELDEAKRENAVLMDLEQKEKIMSDDAIVSLDDFDLLSVLGRGGFGKVMQVRHTKSDQVYAMKVLKKKELVRRKQVERTKTERFILEKAAGHPFVVSLAYAFQTKYKLYMVMDFVQGGDFFTFLRKVGRMRESWAKLYICEIALALQHMHDLDVVYRDLKPENVLLERDGHVKLTDFGLSRSFDCRMPLPADTDNKGAMGYTTRSFCGTEQYMAPEMLLQKGHTKGVDWWCLGLLAHEMMAGKHPFHGGTHYDTLRNMVSKDPDLDAKLSNNAKSLMSSLLTKDVGRRLACSPLGAKEMQVHRLFIGLNWNQVLKKEVPAPYIPPALNVVDTSNFEDTFTREEPIDSVARSRSKSSSGWLSGLLNAFNFGGGEEGDEEGGKGKGKGKGNGKKKGKGGGKGGIRHESLGDFGAFTFKAENASEIGK